MTMEWMVLVFGLILTLLSIFEKYIMLKGRGKQPFLEHEARIAALETEVKEIKDPFEIAFGAVIVVRSCGELSHYRFVS